MPKKAIMDLFAPKMIAFRLLLEKTHLAEKTKNKKNNGEQSDIHDLEQVTSKQPLQAEHFLTTWLQIWYHNFYKWRYYPKGRRPRKAELLVRRPPGVNEVTSLLLFLFVGKIQIFVKQK